MVSHIVTVGATVAFSYEVAWFVVPMSADCADNVLVTELFAYNERFSGISCARYPRSDSAYKLVRERSVGVCAVNFADHV